MHPAMAAWIWSLTMSRVWRSTLMDEEYRPEARLALIGAEPALVRANAYLHTDLAKHPLPDILLDRLADLYWMERDAQLGA